MDWGIAKAEAETSYEVTKKTAKGVKVANVMEVKAKHYGFTDYGVLNSIIVNPMFSECQTRNSGGCTPKP
ncbi:hypothetical protein [Streptomyces sp. TRM70350]|uniref:hypothetical protein n=1 Tax=Streptomyces sp. TRM70350 TaxID=2856165 RepID=UPI001C465D3D|nr:hypothetical protein [Streptomyces sp. TRM70350]MBV7699161.1 hypothetical protein [Streptomyces sp. TRM70350]